MDDLYPINAPGGFAPAVAIGHDDGSGRFAPISRSNPLPTIALAGAAVPAPLIGTAATARIAGPFVPTPSRPVICTLSGEWTGTVRLLRSINGGATRVPVTAGGADWALFSGNACEPVWEESEDGASLWLDLRPVTGTITYRVSQ